MGTARDSGVAGSWQPLQLGDSQRPAAEHGSRDRAEPGAQSPVSPRSRDGHSSEQGEHPAGSPGICLRCSARSSGSARPEQVTEMLKDVVCVRKYFMKLVRRVENEISTGGGNWQNNMFSK